MGCSVEPHCILKGQVGLCPHFTAQIQVHTQNARSSLHTSMAQVPSMAVEAQFGLASAYASRFNQSLTTFQSVFSGFLLGITSHVDSSNPSSRELGRVPHMVLLVMVLSIFVAL